MASPNLIRPFVRKPDDRTMSETPSTKTSFRSDQVSLKYFLSLPQVCTQASPMPARSTSQAAPRSPAWMAALMPSKVLIAVSFRSDMAC